MAIVLAHYRPVIHRRACCHANLLHIGGLLQTDLNVHRIVASRPLVGDNNTGDLSDSPAVTTCRGRADSAKPLKVLASSQMVSCGL